jgi:hypothetical protein
MKTLRLLLLLIIPALLTATCGKKSCQSTYQVRTPIWKKLSDVRQEMHSIAPKVVEQPGKLYFYGNYIFLNDVEKGIHVIDNHNPSAPVNISFIPIPGNVDLAVRGNYLYADSWADLVVFDISNPANIHAVKFVSDVFFQMMVAYQYGPSAAPDSNYVIAGYMVKDTTVPCSNEPQAPIFTSGCPVCGSGGPQMAGFNSSSGGGGGSMARFALVNDYLYAVAPGRLKTFDLANPAQPAGLPDQTLSWNAETIFPFQDKLFIGTNSGLLIFNISTPTQPAYMSSFAHVTACDPVITDGTNAYVTLRTGNMCQTTSNQLDVLDVQNLMNPQLLHTYTMTNPHGLAKDGNLLFICDGTDGLKMYNAQNPLSHELLQQVSGINTYDAIARNGVLLVVAADGLYQYNYSSGRLVLLSKIPAFR